VRRVTHRLAAFLAALAAVVGMPVSARGDATGGNAFALDLYGALRDRPGNLAVSPASLELALTLALAGAKGATADEVAGVLHLPRTPGGDLGRATELMARLDDPARTSYTLRAANRLFVERSYALEPAYLERVATLGAPLEAVDFRGAFEPARLRINRWVAEQTANRIRDLVPPGAVDADTRLALVNAIYLLADWLSPFTREATAPGPFHLAGGAQKDVPTMHQVASFRFAAADGATLLELPYVGDELAMVIVLPDEEDGLAELETGLDAARLEAWIAGMRRERVAVSLPSFTVDPPAPLALAAPLRSLGIELAFDRERADFTGLANPSDPADRLYISEVFHKAFVKVDEKGTEAAAASAVMMARVASAEAPPKEFRADHPFLFVIRDQKTGAFLFLGRVADPAAGP
jgi:serpin B